MTVKSTLPDDARQVTGDALQSTLVDLVGLSLIGKQAHWNLVGPRFRSIHLQLDEVVTAARDFSDTVAERAAALGRLRERIEATEKADPVSQDLLIGITAELEKQRWMFDAENWPKN
jgi:starvation-inducible DNA-binding protein